MPTQNFMFFYENKKILRLEDSKDWKEYEMILK